MNAQELIIGHLLPIAATVAVLWLVYRILFRNSNRLYFNRFFLLTSMLLALAMPLLGLLSGLEVPQMATLKQNMFNGMMLSEVIVTPDGQPVLPEVTVTTNATPSRFSVWQVIGGIYLIGVGVMTLLFLIKLGRLVALIIRSPKRKMDGFTSVFTGKEQGSFSFFRYAFFPNENVDPDIMRHEMSHIEHHHSWDILFAEVMMILQWFNPITRNEKAKGLWWRLLATLPVLAFLLIANTKVTAQEQKAVEHTFKVSISPFEVFDDDGAPMQLIKDTIFYDDDGTYVKFETSDGFQPETGEPCKKLTITSYNADGTPRNNFFITETERRGDTSTYSIEPFTFTLSEHLFEQLLDIATSEEDTVYQIVEEMPEFPGGENALMEYVSKNVVYPEEAKEKEIQGRVFISFVVEKDGSIGEVKVLRGIGGGCDEESVRVISDMPKWKPGKQKGEAVRVSYQIPIMFKLGQTNDEYKTTVKTVIAGDGDYSYKASTATVPDNPAKASMKPDKDGVYQIVEEMPMFPGGEQAMLDYVSKNVVYPEEAINKGIAGRVFVGFIVEKDGSVSEVKVLRGIGGGCDEEAVRVVKSMPKWKPGKMKGKPVRVSYMMPIIFKLQ